VVTGGSRGIGFAIARALAGAGCEVLLAGRDEVALAAAAAAIGPRATARRCDVTDPAAVEALFAAAQELGAIDILVNNAGVAHAAEPIATMPLATWRAMLDTNLTGLFLCCRSAVPRMAAGGTIVNNLSLVAREVIPGTGAYAASKAGGLALTNTLREELRERGIRVLALLAGATDTAIWEQIWPDAPRHRMIAAESVADAVVAAVALPAGATVTELVIAPIGGRL
jgi:NAD(P)-dependent dehydrogenase (short-subunit alcohol dehydrogenase family)